MADIATQLPEVHVMPGEVYVAQQPAIVKTVLGSCVSVTFWSARLGIGALCHGVLPHGPAGITVPDGYRFVDFAIRELVSQLETAGALRIELQIKVFGGADVLPHFAKSKRETVGQQNWKAALETLHEQNLEITASDLGGEKGRILQFNTENGEVLLRRLSHFTEHLTGRAERQ